MVFGYFSRKRKNREIVDGLYRQLTQVARDPVYYTEMQVPDTVMGRFEMLSLVMVLFFRRTDKAGVAVKQLAQDVVDTFFEDIDHSIRELGIGDSGVPKRMKKLARMFYGRAQSYGNALNDANVSELAEALKRNIYPVDGKAGQAVEANQLVDMTLLAEKAMHLDGVFSRLEEANLLDGQLDIAAVAE